MKLLLCLIPGLLAAQSDWTVPPEFVAKGYRKEATAEGVLLTGPGPAGALTRTIDAAPFRGQRVRLRAAIRGRGAHLQLRVDLPGGRLGFFDSIPTAVDDWRLFEIAGEVASDAVTIETGLLNGADPVAIKDVALEKLPPAPPADAVVRDALRRNYERVDSAYAAGDIDAVASLAVPDAQVDIAGARTPLRTLLAQIMDQVAKGAKFRSLSTVTAVQVATPEATVWVNNETVAGAQGVLSSNRDTWVLTNGAWKLKQSTLIGTRPVVPPAVLAEIRQRARMPDFRDVRIVLCECKTPPPIPGFVVEAGAVDLRAAAARAVDYLKAHAPDDAGPAALAFQGEDTARLAAVVRVFDQHRAASPEWLSAREDAMSVYQSVALHDRPAEAIANHIIWLASQARPGDKLLILAAHEVAPFVRTRYGKQLYLIGAVPRDLIGGDFFLDLSTVPPTTPLAQWLTSQKFPYDAVMGQ